MEGRRSATSAPGPLVPRSPLDLECCRNWRVSAAFYCLGCVSLHGPAVPGFQELPFSTGTQEGPTEKLNNSTCLWCAHSSEMSRKGKFTGAESRLMVLSGARNWRTGGDGYRVRDSFLRENVPNLAVEMPALFWEYSKNH